MIANNSLYKLIPEEYNRLLNIKINDTEIELKSAIRNKDLNSKLILKNEHNFIKNDLLNLLKSNNYSIFEVKQAYKNFNDITNKQDDLDTIILSYYQKFYKYTLIEYTLTNRLNKYNKLRISDKLLKYLIRHLFKQFSYLIFTTSSGITLPYNLVFKIIGKSVSIREKVRGVKTLKPDWAASLKTLEEIAKEEHYDIYEAYKNKDIKKQEFISKMKPYVYPNGKKWIVYNTKDLNFWLVVNKRYSSLDNIDDYSITPTNGIRPTVVEDLGIERKQSELLKLMTSVDDIIKSKYLGFRDKLNMIEKFNVEYCKATFNYKM